VPTAFFEVRSRDITPENITGTYTRKPITPKSTMSTHSNSAGTKAMAAKANTSGIIAITLTRARRPPSLSDSQPIVSMPAAPENSMIVVLKPPAVSEAPLTSLRYVGPQSTIA
jgi:hypothetical protein